MQKKILFLVCLLIVVVTFSPTIVQAQGTKTLATAGGPHFRTGDSVIVDEVLEGDVYVAGGNVIINGDVVGDLLVAGGNVEVNGEVTQDLRVAGGNVRINGHVGQNITILGGSVSLSSNSVVGGSVLAAGGTLAMDGQVAGNVVSAGGIVSLAGKFASDVRVDSDSVVVNKDAQITGNLTARYESSADIDEAATIGKIDAQKDTKIVQPKQELFKQVGKFLIWAKLLALFTGVLMGFVSGSVLLYLFPAAFEKLSGLAIKNPMSSLGWGFIQLVMLPISAIALVLTVLGLPLAMLMLLFYFLTLVLACSLAALITGKTIFKLSKVAFLQNSYLQLLVGLVILQILMLIPIVGWLIRLVIFLIALGSLLIFTKSQFRRGVKKQYAKK